MSAVFGGWGFLGACAGAVSVVVGGAGGGAGAGGVSTVVLVGALVILLMVALVLLQHGVWCRARFVSPADVLVREVEQYLAEAAA